MRAPTEVFGGVALNVSFLTTLKQTLGCFLVVVSSAGSGQQSPSTEEGLRGPRPPKMRLNQLARPEGAKS